jgi:hypothetical protein
MSISSTTSRNDYVGNGSASTYPYSFRIIADTDLKVTVKNTASPPVETVLTKGTDYTVTGVGTSGGGNVVLVNAAQAWLTGGNLTTGFTLTVRRVRPVTQTTDIRNQGDFFPEVHEDAFDHAIMVAQQLSEAVGRAMKNPETLPSSAFDPTLPTDINTPDSALITNPTGTGFLRGPTANQIANAQSYATNALASETAAAASATAAAGSATAAAASATAAAASVSLVTPSVIGTRAAPKAITAGTGIDSGTGLTNTVLNQDLYVAGNSAGDNLVSANPQIRAHTVDGATLRLIGRDSSKTVTLSDGTGLSMNGKCTLGADSVLVLRWDGTNWVEQARNGL